MIKNAIVSAETTIKVPFHDVDMLRIAWHGHYVKYFEVARCELFETLGYGYLDMVASGYSWPVIDLNIRYAKPAQYDQDIVVTSAVVEYENRLKIQYEIHDEKTGVRLTRGHTVQVAVDMKNNEMCFASPQILLDRLGVKDV